MEEGGIFGAATSGPGTELDCLSPAAPNLSLRHKISLTELLQTLAAIDKQSLGESEPLSFPPDKSEEDEKGLSRGKMAFFYTLAFSFLESIRKKSQKILLKKVGGSRLALSSLFVVCTLGPGQVLGPEPFMRYSVCSGLGQPEVNKTGPEKIKVVPTLSKVKNLNLHIGNRKGTL